MYLPIMMKLYTIIFKFQFTFNIRVRDRYPFQIMRSEELGGAIGLSIPLGISLLIWVINQLKLQPRNFHIINAGIWDIYYHILYHIL
jgi:hypothetical protein